MVRDSSSQTPIAPLSIGNIINSAIRLYRDRLKAYLGIALKATAWAFLPFVTIAPVLGITAYTRPDPGVWIVVVPLSLWGWFYCAAKSLLNSALISRVAFSFQVARPETMKEASRQIDTKLWQFLWVQILVNLILFVVNLVLSILQNLILLPLEVFANNADSGLALLLALLNLVISFVFLEIYLYVYSYYFIAELPLAVEPNLNSTQSLDRSFKLSQGSIFRIQGTFLIATLITLPLYLLAMTPLFFLIWTIVQSGLLLQGQLPTLPSPELWQSVGLAAIGFLVMILVVNIFLMPFWQTLKSVIYYDLRSRKEGIDLKLSDRDILA